MEEKIAIRAEKQNPMLAPLAFLIGRWKITGSHPYFPGDALEGEAEFKWIEGGAFLMMRGQINREKFPHGIEIFGSDGEQQKLYMLHFDERNVSRKYDVCFEDGELKWWRDDQKFSQRFTLHVDERDPNKMISTGEMRKEGGEWEKDLAQTFERIP